MTSVKQTGQASIQFTEPIYIESAASITGKKEGEGPLGHLFDMVSRILLVLRPGRRLKAHCRKKLLLGHWKSRIKT